MTATTSRDEVLRLVDEVRAMIGRERAYADRLVSQDGSPEARREARAIRCRATWDERYFAWLLSEMDRREVEVAS